MFSLFSDTLNAKYMYEIFQNYGHIDEVFIPAKRDARGGSYGFVRFFDVEDDDLFATNMDNIFIGSRKLNVNIPRFTRVHHLKQREVQERRGGTMLRDHGGRLKRGWDLLKLVSLSFIPQVVRMLRS